MDAPFDCFTVNIFQKELISFLRHRGVMTICAFRYSGTKEANGPFLRINLSVICKRLKNAILRENKEKEQSLQCPNPQFSVLLGKPSITRHTLTLTRQHFSHLPIRQWEKELKDILKT